MASERTLSAVLLLSTALLVAGTNFELVTKAPAVSNVTAQSNDSAKSNVTSVSNNSGKLGVPAVKVHDPVKKDSEPVVTKESKCGEVEATEEPPDIDVDKIKEFLRQPPYIILIVIFIMIFVAMWFVPDLPPHDSKKKCKK